MSSLSFISQSFVLYYISLSALYSFSPAPYSILIMPCVGSSTGNSSSCDCEEFVPKKSKPRRCETCGHRQTSHADTPSTPSELEEGELIPSTHPGPDYAGRVYLSSKATSAFRKARKETLQGYRPPPPSHSVSVKMASTFHSIDHLYP